MSEGLRALAILTTGHTLSNTSHWQYIEQQYLLVLFNGHKSTYAQSPSDLVAQIIYTACIRSSLCRCKLTLCIQYTLMTLHLQSTFPGLIAPCSITYCQSLPVSLAPKGSTTLTSATPIILSQAFYHPNSTSDFRSPT